MDENQNHPPILEVGEANFELEVLQARQPVLAVFLAPWSRPCQVLGAVLAEVARSGRVKVVQISADDNPELSMWYGIQSIPALLFFSAGTVRATIIGTASKEAILARLLAVFPGDDAPSLVSQSK